MYCALETGDRNFSAPLKPVVSIGYKDYTLQRTQPEVKAALSRKQPWTDRPPEGPEDKLAWPAELSQLLSPG